MQMLVLTVGSPSEKQAGATKQHINTVASATPPHHTHTHTHVAGSRMTANLSSFLRFKYTGKGPAVANEEQDLRGFEHGSKMSNAGAGMGTIQESHDENSESPQGRGGLTFSPLGGPTPRTTYGSSIGGAPYPVPLNLGPQFGEEAGSGPGSDVNGGGYYGSMSAGGPGGPGGALPGSLRARHAAPPPAGPMPVLTQGMAQMGLNGVGVYGGPGMMLSQSSGQDEGGVPQALPSPITSASGLRCVGWQPVVHCVAGDRCCGLELRC